MAIFGSKQQPKKAIFEVVDPQGFRVILEEERWRHITARHPEMRDKLELLEITIRSPQLIKREAPDGNIHFYLRLTGRSFFRHSDVYMSAVVERSDKKTARIKTAHIVKEPKKGEIVWLSRK